MRIVRFSSFFFVVVVAAALSPTANSIATTKINQLETDANEDIFFFFFFI